MAEEEFGTSGCWAIFLIPLRHLVPEKMPNSETTPRGLLLFNRSACQLNATLSPSPSLRTNKLNGKWKQTEHAGRRTNGGINGSADAGEVRTGDAPRDARIYRNGAEINPPRGSKIPNFQKPGVIAPIQPRHCRVIQQLVGSNIERSRVMNEFPRRRGSPWSNPLVINSRDSRDCESECSDRTALRILAIRPTNNLPDRWSRISAN